MVGIQAEMIVNASASSSMKQVNVNKPDRNTAEFAHFLSYTTLYTWNNKKVDASSAQVLTWMQQRICQIMIITKMSLPTYILACYYCKRLRSNLLKAFTGAEFRVFGTALVLAQKYLDDNRYTNRTWSKILGIPLNELNEMEMEFLQQINYDIHITCDEYKDWLNETQELSHQHVAFSQSLLQTAASTPVSSTVPKIVVNSNVAAGNSSSSLNTPQKNQQFVWNVPSL